MTNLTNEVRKKNNTKNGNSLNSECFYAFNTLMISNDDIDERVCTYEKLNAVKNLLTVYKNESKEHLKNHNIDEVRFVQPRSKKLLGDVSNLILTDFNNPADVARVLVADKKSLSDCIKYATVLNVSNSNVYEITGETDQSLMFDNICLLPWEDKNLSSTLSQKKAWSQILVETKANAEAFSRAVKREPQTYWGVLTSGLHWCFILRVYENGQSSYTCTGVLNADDNDDFNRISKLLTLAIINCAILVKQIRKMTKHYLHKDSSLDDGGEEEEKDDKDDIDGFAKDMNKLTIAPTANKSTKSDKSIGKKKGNNFKGKKRSFGTDYTNHSVPLSVENVYAHTIYTSLFDHF